jgi:hypothetical protein
MRMPRGAPVVDLAHAAEVRDSAQAAQVVDTPMFVTAAAEREVTPKVVAGQQSEDMLNPAAEEFAVALPHAPAP